MDNSKSISFVDIDSANYSPKRYGGVSYREAMGGIHAINSLGEVIKDVEVFREAYRLIGLGWVYAPTSWPVFGGLVDQFYRFWSRSRLALTRRNSLDQLCRSREQIEF